jgi:DNA-binding response OmpR family regulator
MTEGQVDAMGSGVHRAVVLIVEDDGAVAGVIAEQLRRSGYQSAITHSGAQAMAAWQQRSFDVVITDLNMPNGDGIALVESLRRSEAVPVIFVTGFKAKYEPRLGALRGVKVLEKPFDAKAIVAAVEAALDGKEQGDDGIRNHAPSDAARRPVAGRPHA